MNEAQQKAYWVIEFVIDLIILVCGVFVVLGASGKIRVSKNQEANEVWRKKYGKLGLIGGIMMIVLGAILLISCLIT